MSSCFFTLRNKREISPLKTLWQYNLQESNAPDFEVCAGVRSHYLQLLLRAALVSQRVDKTVDGETGFVLGRATGPLPSHWDAKFPPLGWEVRRCPFLSAGLNRVHALVISEMWTGFHISFFTNDHSTPAGNDTEPKRKVCLLWKASNMLLNLRFKIEKCPWANCQLLAEKIKALFILPRTKRSWLS